MDYFDKLFWEIIEWQYETFPRANASSKLRHLEEELQELENSDFKDREEFADCMLLLLGVAGQMNMNADDILCEVAMKLKKNKARKWGTPDENGVVNHIKEEEN